MTTKLESLAEMWATYREKVIPADAGEVQVSECRRAFYAGASAMFYAQIGGIGADEVPEAEGFAYLERLDAECRAFAADVEGGRA